MFNTIRMDIYRMIHTKSSYVLLVLIMAFAIASTGMTALVSNMIDEAKNEAQTDIQVELVSEADSELYGIDMTDEAAKDTETGDDESGTSQGLSFSVSEPDDSIADASDNTVVSMIISDFSGLDAALFLVIFAVLFATADINSGYIKSVGGQVKSRGMLIISKIATLAIFTAVAFILDILTQCVAVPLFMHGAKFGDGVEMLKIAGVQYILNLSIALFIMSVAIIIKNNVISMIIAVGLSTGMFAILFSGINMLINKMGIENFDITKYVIVNKITDIGLGASGKAIGSAIIVAVVWAAVAIVAAYNVFKRRDI